MIILPAGSYGLQKEIFMHWHISFSIVKMARIKIDLNFFTDGSFLFEKNPTGKETYKAAAKYERNAFGSESKRSA